MADQGAAPQTGPADGAALCTADPDAGTANQGLGARARSLQARGNERITRRPRTAKRARGSRRRRTWPRSRRCASSSSASRAAVSALLKTLGAMAPEERQAEGAAHPGAARGGHRRARRRARPRWRRPSSKRGWRRETLDLTLPAPEAPRGLGPPGQPGDGRAGRDLRRPGLLGRHRARDRGRLAQLHRAQHARKPSGAGDARHVLFPRAQ